MQVHCEKKLKFDNFFTSFIDLCHLMICKNRKILQLISFEDFWSLAFTEIGYGFESNNILRCDLDVGLLAVEIGIQETPVNVFSEGMGHLTTLIKTKLRNRMGTSLLDNTLVIYKNTPHLRELDSVVEEVSDIWCEHFGVSGLPSNERAKKRSLEYTFNEAPRKRPKIIIDPKDDSKEARRARKRKKSFIRM